MAVAVTAAVHPWPTSPPPARRIVAWRVRAAALASNAVICLCIATVWLLFLGLAAMEIRRIACGKGSPVVAAAYNVVVVAVGFSLVLVLVFGVVRLMPPAAGTAGAAADIEAAKQPPSPKSAAARLREALRDPLLLGVLASLAFVQLIAVGALLKGFSPVNESRRERVGSVIYDVGTLSMYMVDCFVVCPILTVRIWRTWRIVA